MSITSLQDNRVPFRPALLGQIKCHSYGTVWGTSLRLAFLLAVIWLGLFYLAGTAAARPAFTTIAAGAFRSLALKADGTVSAWGG